MHSPDVPCGPPALQGLRLTIAFGENINSNNKPNSLGTVNIFCLARRDPLSLPCLAVFEPVLFPLSNAAQKPRLLLPAGDQRCSPAKTSPPAICKRVLFRPLCPSHQTTIPHWRAQMRITLQRNLLPIAPIIGRENKNDSPLFFIFNFF